MVFGGFCGPRRSKNLPKCKKIASRISSKSHSNFNGFFMLRYLKLLRILRSILDSIFLKNRSQGGDRVPFHPSFLTFTFFQLLGVPPGPDLGRFLINLETDFSVFGTNQANTKLLQQTSKPERTCERTSQPERTCERTQQANEPTNEPANPNERAIHSNNARNTASSANRLADALVGSREANRISPTDYFIRILYLTV